MKRLFGFALAAGAILADCYVRWHYHIFGGNSWHKVMDRLPWSSYYTFGKCGHNDIYWTHHGEGIFLQNMLLFKIAGLDEILKNL